LFPSPPVKEVRLIQPPFNHHATVHLEAQVKAISTKLSQGKQEHKKIAMIVVAHTSIQPSAMMIQSTDARFTH
jgi:hypothetical protein